MENVKVLVPPSMESLNLIFIAIVNQDGNLKIVRKVVFAKMTVWTEEFVWVEFVNVQKDM